MATNLDLITSAYRKLNVIDENEEPSPEQGVTGLAALNEMLADWEQDGIRLGWYPQTSLQAEAPLADQDVRGVKHNLAVELAGEYGMEPPARIAEIASESKARLAKAALRDYQSDVSFLPGAGWAGGSIDDGGF